MSDAAASLTDGIPGTSRPPEELHAFVAAEAARIAAATSGVAAVPDVQAVARSSGPGPQVRLLRAIDLNDRVTGPLGIATCLAAAAVAYVAWNWRGFLEDAGPWGTVALLAALAATAGTLAWFLRRDMRARDGIMRGLGEHLRAQDLEARLSTLAHVIAPDHVVTVLAETDGEVVVHRHPASGIRSVTVRDQGPDHVDVDIALESHLTLMRWIPRTPALTAAVRALSARVGSPTPDADGTFPGLDRGAPRD